MSRVSTSQAVSEGEVLRPRRGGGQSSQLKGPVTEALYEMRHLMAASNQGAAIVPKMERRRFKPYNASQDTTTGGPQSAHKPTGVIQVVQPQTHDFPNATHVIASPKTPRDAHKPDTARSSGLPSGRRSAEEDPKLESQRSQDSQRTSSAYRLALDDLNTEDISDIEEIM